MYRSPISVFGRVRTKFFSSLVTAAFLASAEDALALTPARLVYVRGEGGGTCPEESVVRAAVAERMGRDPFDPSAKRALRVELRAVAASAFVARISLLDDGKPLGTRELPHRGACADIVPSMALSIAIALDPEGALMPPAAAKEDSAMDAADLTPGPPAIAAPSPRADAVPPPPSSDPIHLEAMATPIVWVAAAPSTTVGAAAGLGVRWRKISIDVEGRADLPVERRLATGTIASSLVLASLAPCAHLDGLLLCAALGLGSFGAESSGVTAPRSDAAFHAVAGVRAGFELPIASWLWVVARADGLATLTTQRLALDGAEVYTLPRASLGLGIGARLRFF